MKKVFELIKLVIFGILTVPTGIFVGIGAAASFDRPTLLFVWSLLPETIRTRWIITFIMASGLSVVLVGSVMLLLMGGMTAWDLFSFLRRKYQERRLRTAPPVIAAPVQQAPPVQAVPIAPPQPTPQPTPQPPAPTPVNTVTTTAGQAPARGQVPNTIGIAFALATMLAWYVTSQIEKLSNGSGWGTALWIIFMIAAFTAMGYLIYRAVKSTAKKRWTYATGALAVLLVAVGLNSLWPESGTPNAASQTPSGQVPAASQTAPVAKSFVTPAPTKPVEESRCAGADWKDVTFTAEVNNGQCARVELPMCLNIKWEPQAPVTYHVKTSYNEDKEFPAITQEAIRMETPLYPWFEFCADEPLTLNITAKKPTN